MSEQSERVREQRREWWHRHKEKNTAARRLRDASRDYPAERKRTAGTRALRASPLGDPTRTEPRPAEVRSYLKALRRQPCAYCGVRSVTLDHVKPRGRGGEHHWANLVPACKQCNSSKGYIPLLHWLAWRRAKAAFEPWRAFVASYCTGRSVGTGGLR